MIIGRQKATRVFDQDNPRTPNASCISLREGVGAVHAQTEVLLAPTTSLCTTDLGVHASHDKSRYIWCTRTTLLRFSELGLCNPRFAVGVC
jgi:hypothetical protein